MIPATSDIMTLMFTSIYFLALSHAPPVLDADIAICKTNPKGSMNSPNKYTNHNENKKHYWAIYKIPVTIRDSDKLL
jgi:hypothetical protein